MTTTLPYPKPAPGTRIRYIDTGHFGYGRLKGGIEGTVVKSGSLERDHEFSVDFGPIGGIEHDIWYFEMAQRGKTWVPVENTVHNTKLTDSPNKTWDNTILYRLAIALGYSFSYEGDPADPRRSIVVDPDALLEEAIQAIEAAKEDGF